VWLSDRLTFCGFEDVFFSTIQLMLCADGRIHECDAFICASTSDYLVNIHLDLLKQLLCPGLKELASMFGEGNYHCGNGETVCYTSKDVTCDSGR
jgi:hypothetical protein